PATTSQALINGGQAPGTVGPAPSRDAAIADHVSQAEPGNGGAGTAGEGAAGPGQLSLVGTERQRGAGQLLAERPRHGEPEHRSLSALAPGLQPAPVQPGVLECDGQAEAGTAGCARAGRVGTPEPVEDQALLARPETHAVVPDRDRHRIPVPGDRDHHIASFAVLDRVVEQVAQDPLHPAPVHLGDTWFGWQPEVDTGSLAGRPLFRIRGCA